VKARESITRHQDNTTQSVTAAQQSTTTAPHSGPDNAEQCMIVSRSIMAASHSWTPPQVLCPPSRALAQGRPAGWPLSILFILSLDRNRENKSDFLKDYMYI
jgi:hypothetical protein